MEAEDPVEGGKDGHVEAEPLLATLHLDDAKLLHDDVAGFCSVNSTLGQRAVQRNEYETQSYLERSVSEFALFFSIAHRHETFADVEIIKDGRVPESSTDLISLSCSQHLFRGDRRAWVGFLI